MDYDNYEAAGMLLDHEANVNATSDNGSTALHIAAGKDLTHIVELFLSQPSCRVDIANSEELLAYDVAVQSNSMRICQLIEQFTSDLTVPKVGSFSPSYKCQLGE